MALLFQRGAFTAHGTDRVTSVLVVLSLQIVPYMLRDGITRVFYAFNDSRTPLLAGLFSILVNAFFNAILVGPYGIAGIAFSTVIGTVCNAGILSFLVRRHIQDLGLRSFIAPSLKMCCASALSGGIGYATLLGLHALSQARGLHNVHLQALIEILGVLATVGLSYFCFLLLFRVSLANRFLRRLMPAGRKG